MGICQTKIEKRREQLEDSGDDMTPSKERFFFFDAIKESVLDFAPQSDDISVVVIKRT